MSDWWLDHPAISIGLPTGAGLAGMLTGVLAAWLMVVHHVLSPDNVLSDFALGFGGAILGGALGELALWRLNARHAHRA